jgi:hypothetical protein
MGEYEGGMFGWKVGGKGILLGILIGKVMGMGREGVGGWEEV